MSSHPVDSTAAVRLGLMAPLSGLVALYGPEIARAGRIACAEINAAGGLLGRPLELVVEDDGSLPESALPAAERLLDEHGCVALIGNLLSNTRIAVASQIATPRRIPYLNFSFYEGSIHTRWFFHFAALPNQQIDQMIPWMARQAGPKMFFAGSNYEWPRGSIDAAKRALETCGGDVLGEEYYPLGAADIDDVLDRLERSGANVFVPYFAGEEQMQLLTAFTRRGLKSRMSVVMGHYDEAMAAQLPPEVREGLYSSNSYFMTLQTPVNRRYLAALAACPEVNALHPEGNGVLTNFGEGTYLCVKAFAQAVQRAGSLDPEALVTALEGVEIEGPQGQVHMDAASHHAHINSYLARCDFAGNFRIIERFGCLPPLIPERYQAPLAPTDLTAPSRTDEALAPAPGVAVVAVDQAGCIEYVNRTLLRLWKLDEGRLHPGDSVTVLWDEAETLAMLPEWLGQHREWTGTLSARLGDGTLKPLVVVAEPSWRDACASCGYTLACLDAHSLSSQPITSSNQILDMADVAVLAVNARGSIIEANRRATELFGYDSNELVGILVHELVPPQFRQRHVGQMQQFINVPEREVHTGRRAEISGYRKDGSLFPAEITISRCTIDAESAVVVTLRDMTEHKRAENELVWHATHDELTGLPNRALIHERLTRALQRSRRDGHSIALLCIDLDGFKLINDSHGHVMGDTLLQSIAQRIIAHVRPGDTVARLGGDEFVVLCDQVNSPASITTLADRINDLLREPLELQGHRLFATASIGVALGHGTTHNADDMLRDADAAMYSAKEQGRDGWRFFSEEIHEQVRKRLDITNGLRLAIERNELQVRFQPILCTESQLIRGAELLLRWLPPEGEISPAHFIPIAEMTGSIMPIGNWVFHEACRAEAEWRARFGEQAPYVSVNVSARQLNDASIVEHFRDSLHEHQADPARIVLELTETSLMSDVIFNLSVLKQLAELGLRVAVDDFGTGYSSLSQLLRLPLSTLKIDREFVDGLDKRHDSRAIVSAVCSMARAMDLQIIAEGVENEQQFNYLRDNACDYVQGYYFYRPLLPEQFLEAVDSGIHGQQRADSGTDLYALLYVSRAAAPMTQEQLNDLLQRARLSNRAQGVTGFLVYFNGSFMQMLEGPRARVQRLLQRIRSDSRHHSVRLVFDGAIRKRTFIDWSMGFRDMERCGEMLDFEQWRDQTLNFLDMADDPRACYHFISAFAG